MPFNKFLSFVLGILIAASASAHDHWLRADKVNLEPGEKLTLHLLMGEDLIPQEELLLVSKDVERFELHHGNAIDNLFERAHEGEKPAWSDVPDFEGEYLVLMTRGRQKTEMSTPEFSEYLAHEGIAGVTPTSRPVQREHYWRFLKLLGRVGPDEEGTLHHRFLGQQFEIVLIQNPVLMKAGDEQIVQLYLETAPLANQTVFALHRDGDKLTKLQSVTDARGVARFRLTEPGVWVVKSVYMRPCKKCNDADWESFWSAFAFEIGS